MTGIPFLMAAVLGLGQGPVSIGPRFVTPMRYRYCGGEYDSYIARSTAYYPSNSPMEGGYYDRHGNPLMTLQSYLRGDADYVSVGMDERAFPYGTPIRIPEIERYFDDYIDFRVVDTGHAFVGTGTRRIDICVQTRHDSFASIVNRRVTLDVCD